jgi:eukaryotic-like serine/threonine-protein kinase
VDLNRWLQGLPIAARPATIRYRAGKFLRRHRLASALAGLLMASIVAFLATTLLLLAQARAERDRATQMTALLTDLFEIAEPSPQRGNSITARALLDRGAERAALRLQAQPQSHAEFLATLARLYQRLGIYDSAGASLRQALSLQKARLGAGSIEVADLTDHLARVMAADGKFQEAEPLFREALALRRTLLPASDERISNGINNLALVNHDLGRYAQAEQLYREVVGDEFSLARDTDGTTLGNLALLYADLGRFDDSERAYRRVIAVRTALYGAEDVETANAYDELGMVLLARGAHAEGKAQVSRGLAIYRRAFGDDHRDTARSLAHVAVAERMRGDLATAERLQRRALALRIALLGEDHAEVAESRLELGLVLLDRNALDEAGRELRRASAQYAVAVGEAHPLRGRPLHALARWAVLSGDCAKADDFTAQAMALLPARDPRRAELREIQLRCGTEVPQR